MIDLVHAFECGIFWPGCEAPVCAICPGVIGADKASCFTATFSYPRATMAAYIQKCMDQPFAIPCQQNWNIKQVMGQKRVWTG